MSSTLNGKALWLGVPNFSKENLANFDPAYTGYVHIFVIRTPPILATYDTNFSTQHSANFKAIFERMSTSFTGLPELTVNYQDQTHGFADRKVPHATAIESNFDTATIRCLEFKDLPTYSMLQVWLELVGGDEISKIKDYKGLASAVGGYSLVNHSASFIVCTSNPEMTDIIGRAHYITAASPTTLTRDIFHWNSGEIGIVEGHDISLRGILRYSAGIDQRARELLANRKSIINYYASKALVTNSDGSQTLMTNPYGRESGVLNGETMAAITTII